MFLDSALGLPIAQLDPVFQSTARRIELVSDYDQKPTTISMIDTVAVRSQDSSSA